MQLILGSSTGKHFLKSVVTLAIGLYCSPSPGCVAPFCCACQRLDTRLLQLHRQLCRAHVRCPPHRCPVAPAALGCTSAWPAPSALSLSRYSHAGASEMPSSIPSGPFLVLLSLCFISPGKEGCLLPSCSWSLSSQMVSRGPASLGSQHGASSSSVPAAGVRPTHRSQPLRLPPSLSQVQIDCSAE